MTTMLSPVITTGGPEYVEKFTEVAAASFAADPFTRRFISENDNLKAGAVLTQSRRYEHFLPLVEDGANSGAELVEAGGWAGIALWVPPIPKSNTPPKPSTKVFRPALGEYVAKCQAMKQKHLGDRPHWYLNIIGRNPDNNCHGVIRALVDPYLARARVEGVPAWLEATNEHARDVYAHLGFKVVEVVKVSEGMANSKGEPEVGGLGILLYGMIYE